MVTKRKIWWVGCSLLVVAVVVAGTLLFQRSELSSPVPKSITSSVTFPIYYPNAKKLPAGYSLDTASFKQPVSNGVSYTVVNTNNQTLVFSLQPKPSDDELASFAANYIPLNTDIQTPIGTAKFGAYNVKTGTKTLVSLPAANTNTWLIITAPYNINQAQLKQVLNALTR